MVEDPIQELDFIERIRELGKRFERRVGRLDTEEATKNALVMPFINHVLGYNVFDPGEVVPEYTADVMDKKGKKVDYAILKDDKPVILFECKKYGANLAEEQASQLRFYFNFVKEARIGVLTDGIIYRFYSDLEQPNIMDGKPFLEFGILDFEEDLVEELKKFSKPYFNLDEILATASELKYTKEIKRILGDQWSTPTDEFVKFFESQVRPGRMNKAVMLQFNRATKLAFDQFINDRISDRLKSALAGERAASSQEKTPGEVPSQDIGEEEQGNRRIVTTEEELQGYYMVKAILREVIDPKRVAIRDMVTQCAILLDDTTHKPICRFHFNSSPMYLGIIDEQKQEERIPIDALDDIYKYADRLKSTVGYYDKG